MVSILLLSWVSGRSIRGIRMDDFAHEAYLAGVLQGDGWCTKEVGLRVADKDFADAFASSLHRVFGNSAKPRIDQRGYWLLSASNITGKCTYLLSFVPQSTQEYAAWVRGLFDSEGNAQLTANRKAGPNAYWRRVAMYSTNRGTLERGACYLQALAIPSIIRETRNSPGHKGSKTVYELAVRGSRENYTRFATLIGSSLSRKQATLDAIRESYNDDITVSFRQGQLKGARTKHQKTIEQTLPQVVQGIRSLIEAGVKPTQANCRSIPGFNTIQPYTRQSNLVRVAMGIESSVEIYQTKRQLQRLNAGTHMQP